MFPIDSAFKRRWDWEYEPIKYKNTDWKIVIDGTEYSWTSFQRKVNAVSETDLYENITAVIEKNTAKAEIALKPYEIKTLLIDFGEET